VLLQSSERAVADPHLLRQLESQVGTLGAPDLTHLQQVIQSQLAERRQ
jgi:hypothetical protein